MEILNYLLVLAISGQSSAFNIDVVHPIVYRNPTNKQDSYFGYSVQLISTQGEQPGKWILTGAPRADSEHQEHVDIPEPGKLFRCGINEVATDTCEPVLVDPTGIDNNKTVPGRRYIDRKDFGWLGGSIAATSVDRGRVAVCSHRWSNRIFRDAFLVNGACYTADHNVPLTTSFTKLLPLVNGTMQFDSGGLYVYGFGEAGFALHMTGDPEKLTEEMLIGAPGVSFTGTVIRLRDSSPNSGDFSDVSVPLPQNPSLSTNDYFGYSVYSGKFLGDDQTYYVSGAPRASSKKGSVFLFEFRSSELRIHTTITGNQVGEYFGASLLALDVNNDGLDDLLIGAPLFCSNPGAATISGDEGKVYVFVNDGNWSFSMMKDGLTGRKMRNARFGSSIANIGRLTSSTFNDIAVGAPYEEDHGAVYIYQTGKNGVNPKPVQRISGSGFPFSLKGFGISISATDIDDNKFPDLAIGSYLSSHVILLRSQPVVKIQNSLNSEPSKLNPENGFALLTACTTYSTRAEEPSDICVAVTILLDFGNVNSRLVIEANGNNETKSYTYKEIVQKDKVQCRNFPIYVSGNNLDFSRQVIIRMQTNLLSQDCGPLVNETQGDGAIFVPPLTDDAKGMKHFCHNCPVVDPADPKYVDLRVPFVTGCKNETRCESDLNLDAKLIGLKEPFVIGLAKFLTLRTIVTSYKDPAYMTKLDLVLPQDVTFQKIPEKCYRVPANETERYSCTVGNPLNTLHSVTMDFELDFTAVQSGTELLTIYLETTTTSNLVPDPGHKTRTELTIAATTVADILIIGTADEEQKFYWKKNETSAGTQVIPFRHLYEVVNRGSPLGGIDLRVSIPITSSDWPVMDSIEVYVNRNGQTFTCSNSDIFDQRRKREANPQSLSTNWKSDFSIPANRTTVLNCSESGFKCLTVDCPVGHLEMDSRISLSLKGSLLMKTLGDIVGNRDIVLLASNVEVRILNPPADKVTVKIEAKQAMTYFIPFGGPPSLSVDAWVIGLAVGGGILVLVIIIIILIKCGFFKRQRPQEMVRREAAQNGEAEPLSRPLDTVE